MQPLPIILEQAGLTSDQAKLYALLLSLGATTTKVLERQSDLGRSLIYKVLDQLVTLDLVEKNDPAGAVATFRPLSPKKLEQFVLEREAEAQQARQLFEQSLPQLTSQFYLHTNRPHIQFFEGEEGVVKVLADSLHAEESIYSYTDLERIAEFASETNRDYSKKRERRGIPKLGIVRDTPKAREFLADYNPELTSTKLIPTQKSLHTVMQIYDNKISYITMRTDMIIGVIIFDPHIYAMHRQLFASQWAQLPETEFSQPSSLHPSEILNESARQQ